MILTFYTDGACTLSNNNGRYSKGPGGWAYALVVDGKIKSWSNGGTKATTNNEQELAAIYEALVCAQSLILPGDTIEIYSDSAYSINIFTQWIEAWKRNGWTRGKKHELIENLSLIKDIYDIIKEIENENFVKISFIKVKGHSSDYFNNFVDRKAVEAKLSQANV